MFESIKTINDLKRDVLEKFIADLPKEEKDKLKDYLNNHPQKNAAGVFTTVRSYIFNTYFRTTPPPEKNRSTFADILNDILNNNEDDDSVEEE